jgi:hypothetical protein
MSEHLYTLAEIADALAPLYAAHKLRDALAATPGDGEKLVRGKPARAWKVASLPASIRAELESRRQTHRCRTLEDWLDDPRKPWQPPIEMARLSERCAADATRLQRALAKVLNLPAEVSISERARLATGDFKRELGYRVTERHLRRLLTRTIERAAGLNAWHRLELYLPDSLQPKRAGNGPSIGCESFPELEDAFATVPDRNQSSATETAYCWRAIVDCLSERAASGDHLKNLKRRIAAYVIKTAPFLADSQGAFRRNLNRKLRALEAEGEAALFDKRTENSGHKRRAPEWDQNILLMAKWTRVRGSRESQAWRELWTGRHPHGWQFTQAFRDFYPFDERSAKSQVPAAVRAAISPIMRATDAIHLGPRAAKLAQPSIHRAPDAAAGDFYTADDVTINHYWWEEHEFGEYEFDGMRFNVVRGQWLIFTDERTDNPLGFVLMPNRNYDSRVICNLNTKIFSDERIGLPFRGARYEQAIWKARKIKSQFSWSQIDEGFRRGENGRDGISLTVRHATTPKAKVIERVIGSAQNMMDHLPGFVSRDEKSIRFERVQKFLRSLKLVGQPLKAEVDPREMLLSKPQITDEIEKVMRAFADEPQNGERLAGLSPSEAWTQLSPGKPHQVLPDSLRYLLSTDKSLQTVTSEGIKLKIGNLFNYYVGSELLGKLQGEKVQVYYNDLFPEQVVVIHPGRDPKGLNPFSVPLFRRVPATTASAEDFARAKAQQKAFSAYGKAMYRVIAPATNLTLRNENLGSPELRERGQKINALEREQIELQTRRGRNAGTIKQLAARSGLGIDPTKVRNPQKVNDDLRRALELEEQIRRKEEAGAIGKQANE